MEQDEKNIVEKEADVQNVSEDQTQPSAHEASAENVPVDDVPKEQQRPTGKTDERTRRKGTRGKRASDVKKQPDVDPEHIEKVLSIRRVTKVTKGGKKMSFSALVVVGDGKSRVGYAQEKAREVAIAIRKAMAAAKKNMVKIPLKGTTIPHEIIGAWGGARVLLKPASEGTGVIASGPVRAICDGAGIHNILTKCHRSNNPVNVVKATMDGLTRLKSAKHSVEQGVDHAGS